MKTLFFKGEINEENISNLILGIEELNDNDLKIYFTSTGGYENAANIFVDYINSRPELNIHFVFHFELHSSAFDMVFRLKECKKTILDGVYSIIHTYGMEFHTREGKKDKEFLSKSLDISNQRVFKQYRNFLTEKEQEKFLNQEDIYLNDERIRLILS